MNLKATVTPTDLELPTWLQECMLEVDASEDSNGIAEQTLICRAFNFGYQLHEGQRRASGEPYIAHPVSVAELLRDLGGSAAMIAAGFLHDVVEDTEVTPETIESEFGLEVRQLVEGVTKLSKFNFSTKTEREAENFRRMFLAMAQDIRVIVVKLADRLHNMRTLEHLPPAKQRRIAQETRDVFAPLANRLGIWRFKWELEDLAFKYLEPDTYRKMQQLVADKRADREEHIDRAIHILRDRLEPICPHHLEISGRPKHLFSISQKMERQQKEFHEIYDVAAVRVIVKTNEECYRALAVVHDCFRPIPGRFKDYIGLPKPNRYQSLHTIVIGLGGRPLEVQIRTEEMHHIAEYGIAAHWKYKESSNLPGKTSWSPDDEKFTWLRQLLEWQSDLKDAQEYLDNVKDNLFDSEVYVFTPKGALIDLTQGATPVDFAYRIHTEVGNHCFGARVNGRMVTLDTPLNNGDIVEIMTQNSAHPSLDWLNFAASNTARNRIRQWYKRSHREENILRGREMLEKALGKKGFDALLKSEPMQIVANRCNYQTPDDLLAALGYGEVTLNGVANRLRETIRSQQKNPEAPTSSLTEVNLPSQTSQRPLPSSSDSPIAGIEGLVYHMAGCCKPLPGEPIIGAVTLSNRGISIHRQGCSNIGNIPGDRLIPVNWNPAHQAAQGRRYTYPIEIQIEVIDRVGILKDILTRLTDSKVNVHNAQVKTFPGQTAVINLGLDIEHCNQLDQICAQIRKMSDVLKLRRLSQVED
ncbi:bifunctional (p)ppGpp synthetase/guanosine-3',5'-bis(diphosphate) 3'-pyrophosphohydrolase [Acaryochloris sp. IP29b_bin.137]|uniref:RelA/SpoT family protein n=1 Tax=Acaryochloris sp. IP29b_bin.137 TaxID=2969217 RepID=UPI002630FB95|nr:bifunctional (p)ppGpp synthetase/guanosine-3',5'-bis(diphosphate) 3'-pyrophosphohydrolase [Acaryochloris sp. IP29b_bin.137]